MARYVQTKNQTIAYEGDEQVGQITYGEIETSKGPTILIRDVFVKADYRGKGIGGTLFDKAIAAAETGNYRTIAAIGTPQTLEILRKKGFEVDGFVAYREVGK
jgi:GNAT superfamily N-acetyltransferase